METNNYARIREMATLDMITAPNGRIFRVLLKQVKEYDLGHVLRIPNNLEVVETPLLKMASYFHSIEERKCRICGNPACLRTLLTYDRKNSFDVTYSLTSYSTGKKINKG